jgi:hypothetical protein
MIPKEKRTKNDENGSWDVWVISIIWVLREDWMFSQVA